MATWTIDPAHSEVQFKVKHMMISTVTGNFSGFAGTITTSGDNFAGAHVEFTVDVATISTGIEARDGHLKSDDFFNAESFPQMKFVSTGFSSKGGDDYVLEGDLTIRDVTKKVSLNVEFGGIGRDLYGNMKAGFEVSGKINRKEFGLSWSAVTEAGSIVVSDDVKIHCNVQFALQA